MYAGAAVVAAIAGITAVGIAGVAGMGFLLTLSEAVVLVLGASAAVLTVAVAGLLFSMRKTLNTLWEEQAKIGSLEARTTAQETSIQEEEAVPEVASTTERRREGLPTATPFGNIYRVRDVEGIGEAFGVQLEELNIVDTEQLWKADKNAIARELDVSEMTVGRWQSMSELMALEPVEPEHAELIVSGGITSIDELAAMEPTTVAEDVQKADKDREVRIQGHPISEKHTDAWVYAAQKHDPVTSRVSR